MKENNVIWTSVVTFSVLIVVSLVSKLLPVASFLIKLASASVIFALFIELVIFIREKVKSIVEINEKKHKQDKYNRAKHLRKKIYKEMK